MMLLHSPTEDGQGARVLRLKDDSVSVGEVRPVQEGQDVSSQEVIKLKPKANNSRVCDVEVLYDGSKHKGPPRVSSQRFRSNWEAVFGAKQEVLETPDKRSLN